ncbi:MAG: putative RND superfamily exporter protein [Planctomycetota bacterium]
MRIRLSQLPSASEIEPHAPGRTLPSLPWPSPPIDRSTTGATDASSASRSVWPLLAVALFTLALLSPLIIHHVKRTRFDASMEIFLAADERGLGSFEKLEALMSKRTACMILVRADGIFSDEGAQLVHQMGKSLEVLPGVERVFSLTRARRPVRKPGFSLDLNKLIEFEPLVPQESKTDEEWREIQEAVTNYPWASDLLVSKDARWTMLIPELELEFSSQEAREEMRDGVLAALEPYRERVHEMHIASFPIIEAEVHDALEGNLMVFIIVLPLLLATILLITFRSWQILLTVWTFETLGVGMLPVLFGWNGDAINLYTGILFPLIAGLQLTFLTHFLSALQWAQRKGHTFRVALAVALRHVLRPSIIAAITTVIGLGSLLICDVGLVRDFGRLGAQAVAIIFAVTFIPAWLLSRTLMRGESIPDESELHAADGIDSWINRLTPIVDRLAKHRAVVLTVAFLLVLVSIPGLSRVRTDLRAIEFLGEDSPSRQALSAIDKQMGGMNLFELQVDCGSPGSIQVPENLKFIERLEKHVAQIDRVTNVYGYAQIYAMLNQIWMRDAPGSRVVPDNAAMIATFSIAVHGQEFLFEESLYDEELQRTTLFIRSQDMPSNEYLAMLGEIIEWGEANAPDTIKLNAQSGLHSILESDRRIVRSQVKSLLACIAAVFLTLCILWRSPRLALVAVLANLPPLAAVLALHGYAGIPLNSVTVMVGAVVLGIAVDDGIHLLSFWARERPRFSDPRECLRVVLAHKLSPMACTTAILVAGLGLFLFSSFPPVADFGLLSVVALTVALVSTTCVLPPLLLVAFGAYEPARIEKKQAPAHA